MIASSVVLSGCSKRDADVTLTTVSPSGSTIVRFAGYQPRGTVDGYATVAFSPQAVEADPQITLAHMINVKAGWLDDRTFVFVYDVLWQRRFVSPVYPTRSAGSEIEIITCSRRHSDCSSLERRLNPAHTISVAQFPEGDWPSLTNVRYGERADIRSFDA